MGPDPNNNDVVGYLHRLKPICGKSGKVTAGHYNTERPAEAAHVELMQARVSAGNWKCASCGEALFADRNV